ncbi:fimbrial protein [Providencia rettgeri]|uniref:fimbrial protein n=1 Tax=Providencia TaxID=586 RepID=UPI001CFB9DC1|nr:MULTISPECIES: fimbrial protein [Providencia]MCB4815051.1 type 1 fimbrial protein [Providencia rettgeri]MCG9942952.1 type 1 fimbrial protein [Providencia rettgeri]MCJ2225487.1 type 1 fimbrial protein [Providencia rettgeri]MCJ2287058.1 type 1 fimbrial protein [Providencia rettgeri]MCK8631898.1 type 1 fimbrial protein [Providencia rettgeri]
MKIKLLPIVACLSLPVMALAAPQVTFMGEVTDQTCQPQINGETNSVVLLPTVRNSELQTVGATAGLTPFTISLTGCTAPTSADLNINTVFLGHNVTTKGNLGNIAEDIPATNVELQLLDSDSGTNAITLNGPTTAAGLVLKQGETSTDHKFAVQYISEDGSAQAGKVKGIVEYTVSYL